MRPIQIVNQLEFLPIEALTPECQIRILDLRNQPEVRQNMYTTHEISTEEHLRWLGQIKRDATNRTFAIQFNDSDTSPANTGSLIGCISLSKINLEHRRADWSFYVGQDQQGKAVGGAVEFKFLDFVFSQTQIEKLNCEVLDFNQKVIQLHQRFGFVEEGIRRNHIHRGGQPHDAHLLGITKSEWVEQRKELTKRLFRDRTRLAKPKQNATSVRQQNHIAVN